MRENNALAYLLPCTILSFPWNTFIKSKCGVEFDDQNLNQLFDDAVKELFD
jgi:hypothetical protein